jgi:1-acyl-sn-glycerol-3-phosphate acyltransferase
MQYLRSKSFDLFLVLWTIVVGLGTPVLMIWNNQRITRGYSLFWARGIAWGIWNIVGLTYRVDGKIPNTDTPKLIISNHQSMWETILFTTLIGNVVFVAKKELTRIPIFGWYMKKFPMVLIDRSNGRSALAEILEKASIAVSEGRSVLIFPEGTRIQPDEEKKFLYGVAALYGKLNIPAITIAHNSGCFWNKTYKMKHSGRITLRIIEEIPPGMGTAEFLRHIEASINEHKRQLRDSVAEDERRRAAG